MCETDVVSDILVGKSDNDITNGVIDEFVTFGKKFIKYWEVKVRSEKRKGEYWKK